MDYERRWLYSLNDKTWNQRINYYGTFSKHKIFSLSFLREHGIKKIQCVKKIIPEITESLGSDYIIYMDNDSKHISIESIKFYRSNLISIKLEPAY